MLKEDEPLPPAESSGLPRALQEKLHANRPAASGLYLHVPFCFHKCHYCDFYSIVDHAPQAAAAVALGLARPQREAAFADRLARELELRAEQFDLRPATIFAGGGTPTLMAPATWEGLLNTMARLSLLDAAAEFTVEANPETVTPELARALAAGGVNRVSLGAQSFQPALLRTLERWHEPVSVSRAVDTLRTAGISNINLDLIFAIPGQTLDMLDVDLDAALALEPTHLSCYSLIYEPNTAMLQRLKMGQVTAADEELERQMFERVMARLAAAGFVHYEVSNWARSGEGTKGEEEGTKGPRDQGTKGEGEGTKGPRDQGTKGEGEGTKGPRDHGTKGEGTEANWREATRAFDNSQLETRNSKLGFACRHNLLYWENGNWIGVGPAAASHVDGVRWKNVPHLGRYLASHDEPPTCDHEHLPDEQAVGEQLMLRLRLIEGVPLDWLDSRLPATDRRRNEMEQLVSLGLLERTATRLRLTADGLFVANGVLERLI